MTDRTQSTLSAALASTLPGTWKLPRGRAITLRPATDGILRVARGRLWATRNGPHGQTPDDAGDHMLEAGRSMFVRSGERVVIESWMPGSASYFAWDPVPRAAARRRLNLGAVRQPLADLRLASLLLLRALGALGTGMVQVGCQALGRCGQQPAAGRRAHV